MKPCFKSSIVLTILFLVFNLTNSCKKDKSDEKTLESLNGGYKMEDFSGGKIIDYSSHINHGTPSSIEQTEGKCGKGVLFNNSDDQIYIKQMGSFSSGLTIDFWIKLIEVPDSISIELIDQDNSYYDFFTTSSAYTEFEIGLDTNHVVFHLTQTQTYDYSYQHLKSKAKILNNQWYHIGATYNGSEMKIYINGELDSQLSILMGNIASQSSITIMSSCYDYYTPEAFSIAYDNIRFWNKTFDAASVKSYLMQCP